MLECGCISYYSEYALISTLLVYITLIDIELRDYNAAFFPMPLLIFIYSMMGQRICKYELLRQEVSVESLILRWPLRPLGLLYVNNIYLTNTMATMMTMTRTTRTPPAPAPTAVTGMSGEDNSCSVRGTESNNYHNIFSRFDWQVCHSTTYFHTVLECILGIICNAQCLSKYIVLYTIYMYVYSLILS